MGASTITGFGGGNGAAGNQKGPKNGRSFFVPNATPHIIAAGKVAFDGTNAITLNLNVPTTTTNANYIAMATVTTGTNVATGVVTQCNGTGTNSGILTCTFATVAGVTPTINYAVITTGLA